MARLSMIVLALGLAGLLAAPATAERPVSSAARIVAQDSLRVLASSTFWKKSSNTIEGMWRIEEREDGRFLVLGDGFRTKSAPDLKLVLSPNAVGKITKKNALAGGLIIAPLKSPTGAQEYEIPAGVSLDEYKTLAIHCEQFTKLWGSSSLSEGEVIASADAWDKKTKKTKGGYEIVRRESGLFIRFSEDFKAAKPPEPLRILLSPLPAKDAKNKNAEDGAVFVGTLANIKGGQEYRIDGVGETSEGDELSGYRSVLLNCKKYTKLWSAAPLGRAAG